METFKTLDGVNIRVGIDECYSIDTITKRLYGPRDYNGRSKKLAYFSSKQKADVYLHWLKGGKVEYRIPGESIWNNTIDESIEHFGTNYWTNCDWRIVDEPTNKYQPKEGDVVIGIHELESITVGIFEKQIQDNFYIYALNKNFHKSFEKVYPYSPTKLHELMKEHLGYEVETIEETMNNKGLSKEEQDAINDILPELPKEIWEDAETVEELTQQAVDNQKLDIAIKIRDNGYICNYTLEDCKICHFSDAKNDCCLRVSNIKFIIDSYIKEHTPKPKRTRPNDCKSKDCLDFTEEGNCEHCSIDNPCIIASPKPNIAKTRDGVEVEVDDNYLSKDKLYFVDNNVGEAQRYYIDHSEEEDTLVFHSKAKAELFSEGVNGKQLQIITHYLNEVTPIFEDRHHNDIDWSLPIAYIRVKPETDKHAALKEAYRNGATIQLYSKTLSQWIDFNEDDLLDSPWDDSLEYRVKPEEEFAELKEAYSKGAIIEYYSEGLKAWHSCIPSWTSDFKYRVKPTPQYKPFDTINYSLYGKRINHKTNGNVDTILGFKPNNHYPYQGLITSYTNDVLFYKWAFEDGTPIGELIN